MSRLTSQAGSVSDALETRFSCRAFLDKPVPEDDIRYILQTALRARPPAAIFNPGMSGWCKVRNSQVLSTKLKKK